MAPQAPNARKRPGTAVALLDFASTSTWGPRNGPQAPNARKRPGTAVALLDFASTSTWGPRNGPQAPNARKRPGTAVALLDWSCPGSVDGELLSRSSPRPLRRGYRGSIPGDDRRS